MVLDVAPRRRVPGTVRGVRRWAQRAGVVLVAIAIVALHHLVAAHQHSGGDESRAMPDAGPLATLVEPPGPASVSLPSADPARPQGTPAGVAKLHVHPAPGSDGHDPTGGTVLLALSLAAIAAAVALVVTLAMVSAAASGLPRLQRSRYMPRRGAARPPPRALRLAQLQVLRV